MLDGFLRNRRPVDLDGEATFVEILEQAAPQVLANLEDKIHRAWPLVPNDPDADAATVTDALGTLGWPREMVADLEHAGVPSQIARHYRGNQSPAERDGGASAYVDMYAHADDPNAIAVRLPDGTDTSDPDVRRRAQARLRRSFAELHGEDLARRIVLLWPTMPDTDSTDGAGPIVTVVDPRPNARTRPIDGTGRSLDVKGFIAAGEASGHGALVEVNEVARTVTYAHLDPAVSGLRDRLAQAAKVDPWQVELACRKDRAGRIASIQVLRAPWIEDPSKRRSTWLTRIQDREPCSDGRTWRYHDVDGVNQVRLDLETDPLDIVVPWAEDPSAQVSPSTPWRLGVDENGRWIDIRLDTMAHGLIAGATRSGKSVATYSLMTHVLRMGPAARLLVADPNDTTIAPFEDKVAWSTSSTKPGAVTAMLKWLREEMDRRKVLMRDLRTDAIRNFSEDLPLIVVIIDEAANYLRHADAKARDLLRGELLAVVSQGAKYGIRLILITQRPDSQILDTATRAQLSFRISFRLEDAETAKMAFPDFEDPSVLLRCKAGVGWMREVGEQPRRFRAAYLADHWGVADLLPFKHAPISIETPDDDDDVRGRGISSWSRGSEPEVIEVVEVPGFSFGLDDLATGADGAEATVDFDWE